MFECDRDSISISVTIFSNFTFWPCCQIMPTQTTHEMLEVRWLWQRKCFQGTQKSDELGWDALVVWCFVTFEVKRLGQQLRSLETLLLSSVLLAASFSICLCCEYLQYIVCLVVLWVLYCWTFFVSRFVLFFLCFSVLSSQGHRTKGQSYTGSEMDVKSSSQQV